MTKGFFDKGIRLLPGFVGEVVLGIGVDRKSTRLNSSH